jgi:uncharacterized membrane protein YedE/YeeE
MEATTSRVGPFQAQYEALFGHSWPVFTSALALATMNVFLFAYDRPWTASDGVRNWGDWLFQTLGLTTRSDLISPLLYSGSILNLGLLLGALAAALMSRDFSIRVAPPMELLKGAVGGFLMGNGAVLAFGCNIGGFFSALSALSLSGFAMMAGLMAGAYLTARYLVWEVEHWPHLSTGKSYSFLAARSSGFSLQPLLGILLLVALLAAPLIYQAQGYGKQAGFLLFGLAFGIIFQRSRFCLVRAFREPFMTGESDHTRAAAVALIVSMIGFSILKLTDLKDAGDWVFPGFWIGGLSGGFLFGVGMVLAGGCGAGSIWRAGEGHLKLWLAVILFALGASLSRMLLVQAQVFSKLGSAIFLPHLFGWTAAIYIVIFIMATWYIFASWNERSGKFASM